MGDTLTEAPNNCRTPIGEQMFDLNKEIPWSPATKENKNPTGAWMFDLNEEIPCSPITLEGKTASIILNKEVPRSSSLASLGLLNKYVNRMKRPNQYLQNGMRKDELGNLSGRQKLSTVDLVKVATSKFMNALSLCSGDISKLIHPLNGGHFGPFSEVSEDVELLLYLLASAAKVADQQFRDARKYLNMCNHLASRSGTPVQRIVHYFAEALGDRIDRETGIASSDGLESIKRWVSQMSEDVAIRQASILPHQKELPFFITVEPAAMQVILDNMASERRIHLIDLHIRSGLHWTILMQALAVRREYPVEMLTITAVGTISIEMVEATGRRLSSFAESMSLPFSFKIVMMLDEKDLSKDFFELEAGDAVGIYSAVLLWKIKERPNLITVLKTLSPIVMVVSEVETYTDLPDFMDQFSEALFYYCASFDAFEAYLDHNDPYRMSLEGYYYRGGIQNVVRFKREDRVTFHMKIDGWREFFERFGMVEREMSMSSLYQARLMLEKYASGSSCTLDMDGKCMLLGWKGTPLLSLSAWKFLQLKDRKGKGRANGYDS